MAIGENDVRIDITADTSGLKAGTSQAAAQLSKLDAFVSKQTATTRDANTQAEKFIASLKREAETFGKTRGQVAAYDAQMKGLTGTHRDSVKALGSQLDALNANEKMLGRVKLAAAAAGATIGYALVQSFKLLYKEVTDAEQSAARLEAVYRSTGGAVKLTLEQIKAVGEELYRTTLFDDDQITDATAVMLTFKSVTGDTFRQAMQMSADLAAVMKTDLQSAVVQLGKALEDPEQGLTALKRSGVSFTDEQRNMIKAMVETGNQSAALTEIMRIMREQGFDKTAQAMKTGITREADDLSKSWRDLLQTMGETSAVKGTIETVFGSLKTYLTDMKNVIESGNWFDRLTFFTLGYSSEALVSKRAPRQSRGASGSWGDPVSGPADPAIAQAVACYNQGGKWENGRCVLPGSRTRSSSSRSKPPAYADVFSGQEYSNAQMKAAAAGKLGGFSYITNSKDTSQFIREQQAAINELTRDQARDATEAERELLSQQEKNAAALETLKEKYLDLGDPLRQYYQQLDELAVLKEKFPQLAELWMEAELNVHEQIDAALDKTADKTKEVESLWKDLGATFSSAFEDAIVGGKGLSSILKGLEQDIVRIVTRKLVTEPLTDWFGEVLGGLGKSGGSSGGSTGGWAGAIGSFVTGLFNAQGNVFQNGAHVTAFASGGILDKPTLFPMRGGVGLAGEAGTEAIMPVKRTRNGDMGVKVEMGGQPQQVVTNNFILQGRPDIRTQSQISMEAARAQRRVSSRFGG